MWQDIEYALDYVHKNYVLDPAAVNHSSSIKRTRLYAYGVSLGGQVLLMYLGKAGKKASEVLDGAMVFSAIWETRKSNKWFIANLGGLYDFLIGKSVAMSIKSD